MLCPHTALDFYGRNKLGDFVPLCPSLNYESGGESSYPVIYGAVAQGLALPPCSTGVLDSNLTTGSIFYESLRVCVGSLRVIWR